MPRVADHEERRHQVAAAAGRLIATQGLNAVTVAKTAAEAGISVGLVQHYFRTKNEMLLFTYRYILESVEHRLAELVVRAEKAGTRIEHILLDGLAETLPLDERRRQECRVALAFTGRATDDPHLGEVKTTALRRLRSLIATAVTNAKECGEVPATTDATLAAARIAAYAEGLATHLYTDPDGLSADASLVALGDFLAGVFTGECRLRGKPPGVRPR
ncbi:TetR/AcrR family transcriptional regulator [Streptomyces sp. NPDC050509]|uniref:TetR/AcrR family transcriptional regulator n=1 Tax=Streptomyces sp. NPDC050509 TaxID=3365620 RepID=UPI0037BCB210